MVPMSNDVSSMHDIGSQLVNQPILVSSPSMKPAVKVVLWILKLVCVLITTLFENHSELHSKVEYVLIPTTVPEVLLLVHVLVSLVLLPVNGTAHHHLHWPLLNPIESPNIELSIPLVVSTLHSDSSPLILVTVSTELDIGVLQMLVIIVVLFTLWP